MPQSILGKELYDRKKIRKQILAIRDTGRTNMFDVTHGSADCL
jgi:hypothetical protein